MRLGSLFSGIGGFDLGLERAGWTCAFQVELDPFCQRVLAERWPGVERFADVRSLGRGDVQPERHGARAHGAHGAGTQRDGAIDLLVGGFPCQDLSVAGKRAGLVGERSGLFWEIVRIAHATRPTWGVFENVPGLLSSHGGRDMATVLEGLRQCWPVVGYRVLDSQHFGVAQRRRRVFLVGGPTDAGVAQVLALTEGGGWHPAEGGEAGTGLARCLATGTNGARYDGDTETFVGTFEGRNAHTMSETVQTLRATPSTHRDGNPLVVAATLNSGGNTGGSRTEPGAHLVVHALTGEGHDASNDPNLVVGSLIASDTPRGHGFMGFNNNQAVAAGHLVVDTTQITSAKNYSNPRAGDPCHPMAGDRAPLPVHAPSSLVRRLTPLECERLQAFPDGWTCLCQPLTAYAADPDAAALACRCPDSPRYRALGNAVTVSVIEWLGRRIAAVPHPTPKGTP